MDKTPLMIPHLPMKDMDGTMLTLAINEYVSQMSPAEQVLMNNAMALAAYLHRKTPRITSTRDTAGVRNQPTTPYIVHPLRNTLRLLRWGVRDVEILAATLLHDVVEDHPREIVREFTDTHVARSDHEEMRKVAVRYLALTFSARVAHLVRAVSNPILSRSLEKDARNARYIAHVEAAVKDASVFLVKVADVVDNALSLHHSDDVHDPKMVGRAVKYLPLADILPAEFESNFSNISKYISAEGAEQIRVRLAGMKEYLLVIANG